MLGSDEVLVQYSHPGRLGTRLVTAEVDATVTHRITFPYGTVLDSDTIDTPGRTFASYDRGSFTGLDYAVNRYYDPRLGRFTQVDPLDMQATDLTDPQSLSLYAYARNDPVNVTDPVGLIYCDDPWKCGSGLYDSSGAGMLPGDRYGLGGWRLGPRADIGQRDYSPSGDGWLGPCGYNPCPANDEAGDTVPKLEYLDVNRKILSEQIRNGCTDLGDFTYWLFVNSLMARFEKTGFLAASYAFAFSVAYVADVVMTPYYVYKWGPPSDTLDKRQRAARFIPASKIVAEAHWQLVEELVLDISPGHGLFSGCPEGH
jgi:RHS repeat-associated protein